jgi:alkylhydroperoxidase family enzyme
MQTGMHVPALADRVAALENYFRFNAALPVVDRELVIMATAREINARYPWARHEARGRGVGTRIEAIEAVRVNGTLEQLTGARASAGGSRAYLAAHARVARRIVCSRAGRTGSPTTDRDSRARGPL